MKFENLEPIEKQLTSLLTEYCKNYDGVKYYKHPKFLNFGGFDLETKVLTIQSTQISSIKFEIITPFNYVSSDKFWYLFKEFRNELIYSIL
jgi:hypothetical protein